MEELWLPDSIKRIIQGKEYKSNHVGMSNSQVFIFDDMALKIQEHSIETDNEHNICKWLELKFPIPQIFQYEIVNGKAYCLMSKIKGRMLCEETYMTNPSLLLECVSQALEMLWSVDITDCPCSNTLDTTLKMAKYNVENHLVDLENVEPETFGPNGFASPEELLYWLENNRPEEELVFSHGDFCLPNIFADGNKITGFIDLGRMGIADRWQDIAICYRSLNHNFEGIYNGGIPYKGYKPERLFEMLGMDVNVEKLNYYILLDELF